MAGSLNPPDNRGIIHRVWRIGEHWCVVARNSMGFYLGYVSVPEGHPWHGQSYDDITADVHGGLTFSNQRDDWEVFDGDGAPPGWYVGFDLGHYCCAPIPGSYMDNLMKDFRSPLIHPPWTEDAVATEVGRLAVQAQLTAVVANAEA